MAESSLNGSRNKRGEGGVKSYHTAEVNLRDKTTRSLVLESARQEQEGGDFSLKKILGFYFIKRERYIGFLWCFYKPPTATSAFYNPYKRK